MLPDPRFPSSYALAIALTLGACGLNLRGTLPQENDGGGRHDSGAVPFDAHIDAHIDANMDKDANGSTTVDLAGGHDASTTFDLAGGHDAGSMSHDAAPDSSPRSTDAGGGTVTDAGVAGVVSCFSKNSPDASCTLPTYCCFGNYNSDHDGDCRNRAQDPPCTWGTIDCDGPEDCGQGQRCCAHVKIDPMLGIVGHTLACQNSPCGAAPANQELCHPTSSPAGTCSSGSACVTALGNDNDLPRSLYICQ